MLLVGGRHALQAKVLHIKLRYLGPGPFRVSAHVGRATDYDYAPDVVILVGVRHRLPCASPVCIAGSQCKLTSKTGETLVSAIVSNDHVYVHDMAGLS